jgi:hypothetical protein
MPEKHEVETKAGELLDRTLARYAGEPLTGLESRTMARLRVEQEAAASRFFKRARLLRWLGAATAGTAAVAASLIVGIQIGQHRADAVWQQRVANATAWNSVKPAGTVTVPPAPAAATVKAPRTFVHRAAAPQLARKAAQFPSPVPLTAQERSLAHLAAADPAMVASLARSLQTSMTNDSTQAEEPGPPR